MLNSNDTLPDNLKTLLLNLQDGQAMTLGLLSQIPFVTLKIANSQQELLEKGDISCELKASVFNIDNKQETIAIAFVQIRLNENDEHIYTLTYNLNDSKQYEDCAQLLAMQKYGLFIATEDFHDFLAFDAHFEGGFDPVASLDKAKSLATAYSEESFNQIAHALYTQMPTERKLWDHFIMIAPMNKAWYARMRIQMPEV